MNRTQSAIFFLLVGIIVTPAFSQSPTAYTDYANFHFADQAILWRRIYDRPGMTIDSLKQMISLRISTDATFQLIEADSGSLTIRMIDKVFEKNGDKISGLVTFDVKNDKYRVTLQSLTRKMGIKTMRTARAFGVASEVSDYNGVRFEDDFLTKTLSGIKTGTANLRGLDFYDKLFERAFKYLPKVSQDGDW